MYNDIDQRLHIGFHLTFSQCVPELLLALKEYFLSYFIYGNALIRFLAESRVRKSTRFLYLSGKYEATAG